MSGRVGQWQVFAHPFKNLRTTRRARRLTGALFLGLSWCGVASAGYVGESFLQIPDLPGGWQGENYKDWVKFEAREWIETPTCAPRQTNPNALVCDERFYQSRESHLFFSAPWAPPSGPGKLAV